MITIEIYKTNDGKEFQDKQKAKDHEAAIKGLIYKCPACSTSGQVVSYTRQTNTGTEPDGESFANLGWRAEYEDVMRRCDCCKGIGYSARPFIEKFKTIHDGWEQSKD